MPQQERYLPSGWEELAARYGHQYVYMGGKRDNYPQVITSKYPIENVKRIIGNEADSIVTHGAGWARISAHGKQLNLVTLHTWPQKYAFGITREQRDSSKAVNGGDKYRRMEMEFICKETIAQSRNAAQEYWMMMGDFNAKSRVDNWFYKWPQDTTAFLVHDYIHANTPYIDVIKDKYPDKFFTTTGGKTRIDFFYCTAPLYKKITGAEIISDDYTTPVRNPQKLSNFWHPSDHRPILVEFEL
jgi:endonuclease/exonuclease/phosphatase family metal-dependent hydrolase